MPTQLLCFCIQQVCVWYDREAADFKDVVVLPHTWESYFNITHQTLEMCRIAAMDASITHLVKVDDDSYVHMARLLIKLRKMPREKLFFGYMEKAGLLSAAATLQGAS